MFTLFRNMNLVTFAVLLFCGHAYSRTLLSATSPYLDLSRAVNKLKDIMKTGNDSLGIPILDPFIADEIPIKLDEEEIQLNATLNEIEVYGLSDFDLIKGDYDIGKFRLVLNISWPLIKATTKYILTAKADIFEIYGKGLITASVRDFVFELDIAFSLNNGYLKLKEITSGLSLRELDFRATGLFDDEELSELLSTIISDIVPDFIDDYQDKITEKLNIIITKILDGFLAEHSLSEILSWIMG